MTTELAHVVGKVFPLIVDGCRRAAAVVQIVAALHGIAVERLRHGVADPETVEALHVEELTHGNKELPILMLCDTFNRVYWIRQGYNIGLADQLMDALRKIILKE